MGDQIYTLLDNSRTQDDQMVILNNHPDPTVFMSLPVDTSDRIYDANFGETFDYEDFYTGRSTFILITELKHVTTDIMCHLGRVLIGKETREGVEEGGGRERMRVDDFIVRDKVRTEGNT